MEDKPNGVQVTPSPEGKVQVEGKGSRRGKGHSSPKTSKDVLLKCRLEYEVGSWNSIKELADRYNIHEQSLYTRIRREGWKVKREQIIIEAQRKVEQKVVKEVSEADAYLKRLNLRSERYEAMLSASVSQLATTNNGVPLCEPSDLDTLSRSEIRVMEMRKTALKIVNQVDVLSNGQGLGDSFISAIAKLRDSGAGAPKLQSQDLDKVLDAEIE